MLFRSSIDTIGAVIYDYFNKKRYGIKLFSRLSPRGMTLMDMNNLATAIAFYSNTTYSDYDM